MPRIFDNIDTTLGPAIRESLRNSTRLDTAVGYFNIRGWSVGRCSGCDPGGFAEGPVDDRDGRAS